MKTEDSKELNQNNSNQKKKLVNSDIELLKRELKKEKEARQQSQSILDAHNRILEYSYKSNLHYLLKKSLDEIEILAKSTVAFFHFLEDDQKDISLQAWSTNTELNMCKAEGDNMHYPVDKAGVWADSIRLKKALVHNDYQSLSNKKGMPEGHAPIRRELVVPIFRNKKIVAILGVGNKSDDYTENDVLILQQIADFTWEIAFQKNYNRQ